MRDGTEITLRPIRPEDEPLWFELLEAVQGNHLFALPLLLLLAVARGGLSLLLHRLRPGDGHRGRAQDGQKRRILGVGRLTADPTRTVAEYAVLVQDDWQNRGLGGILTDYCTEIARAWGSKRSSPTPRPITPG